MNRWLIELACRDYGFSGLKEVFDREDPDSTDLRQSKIGSSMEIDYSPFLHVLQDGKIWWRLEDAIKLGAGYLSVRDDEANLVPVLRANNNRVRANERTLLGEFSPEHYSETHPRILQRDDGRYVEADEFMNWLSQHISQTQSDIPFPSDLAREVKLASINSSREASPPSNFESLTIALEDWLGTSFADLPDALRQRVEREFFPMPWDSLSADERRSVALRLDYQRDPATERDRQFLWNSFARMRDLEKEIATWEGIATPTANELALKETRLVALRQELACTEKQQLQSRGDYYPGRKGTPDTQTKTKGHLDHDPQMQQRANEIAAEKKKETKRPITRDKVAKLLATELGMSVETVLRRIRKQW